MSDERDPTWRTKDEILWLKSLGTHSSASQFGRLLLLHQYAAAIKKRRVWDLIDRQRIHDEIQIQSRGA